ncbi:alpha/beta hydrolase fold domain-containing protein [Erythrobacter sp. 3-20A1M]|uniref:alpha/beta hydrolase n=1 Tax=Erythrobacter sp. 3-20A1M TaxID=2653850 RepID=UPI001BFC77F2|nr:alpha/beta hydrolase [Erythrobacter sp. 3-20A1M]QWC57197.1 alpha/beta hydrolase fold domain-containing protein [Erythrobacter sp. 3-20A1M]
MRGRIALAGLAIAALAAGVVLATTSPPSLLSGYDWAWGGDRGATKVAKAVPFGSHAQTLDIWRPEGTSASVRLPVVIFWYGGGWVKGDRAAYAFAGRALANAGFLVVIPDYRKVPAVRFPAFLQDGAEAVRWTRDNAARYGGDPDRIALVGHSAGAYEAIMLALDGKWLREARVDPAIVKAAIGLSGPYDFYPFDTKRSIDAMSRWPRPLETQPITYARADAPPLLLVTSNGDETVRHRNADRLAAKLRKLGAPVELKNYGPIDHEEVVMALSTPFRDKAPVLADSVAFLKRNLGQVSQ